MGNAYAYLGLRSPDRVPVLCRRICDSAAPRRGRGPSLYTQEGGRGWPWRRDELLETSVSLYIVETNLVHNISQSS